jgi:cysteine desulfurase
LIFLVASAHKFHGPKGVGFAFVRKNSGFSHLFHGEQEKGLRAGTEAVHQIAGMAKQMELSMPIEETEELNRIEKVVEQLEIDFPGFIVNGSQDGFTTC